MFSGKGYEIRTCPFAPGDTAVLFTDGIPDGRNAEGKDYSENRLQDVVRANAGLPAAEICQKTIADINGYACWTQPCDDMTLVVIKRTSS
jgi:serine phosphatase RsbU (regulator of sigma subunit)